MVHRFRIPLAIPAIAATVVLLALGLFAPTLACAGEAEAEGLVIRQNGEVVASVWQGTVSGPVDAIHETVSDPFTVTFLDPDSIEFTPDPDMSLVLSVSDPSLVGQASTGPWSWTWEGLIVGKTSFTVSIFHIDHLDYTSPAIELHVEEGHAEAEGLVLRQAGVVRAVVWQGLVTGALDVAAGGTSSTIQVAFLDPDSVEFLPEGPDFYFDGQIAHPSLAALTQTGEWSFRLDGLAQGTTALQVQIFHIDHPDFTAPLIPVNVISPVAVDDATVTGRLHLAGVTPNPMRDAGALHFTLPAAASVELTIHDVRGRRVAEVFRGRVDAGSHVRTWTATDLAPGLYFARLHTPLGDSVRRVMVVR